MRMNVWHMADVRTAQKASETLVKIQGVADIGMNVDEGYLEVQFDPKKTDESAIRSAMQQAGFEVR